MAQKHFEQDIGDNLYSWIGPMFSGKTDHALTQIYNLEQHAGKLVVACKSVNDERGEPDLITSSSGKSRNAYPIVRASDVELAVREDPKITMDDVATVYFDEAGPFIEDAEDFRDTITALALAGKMVVISSIEIAGNGLHFPTMAEILKFNSPNTVRLHFPCQINGCKNPKGSDTIVYDRATSRPFRTFSTVSGKRFPFKLPDRDSEPRYYDYKVGCHQHAIAVGKSALAINYEEFAERESISPDSYKMVA